MITYEYLKEIIEYDPETGKFQWKINRKGRFAKKGNYAGRLNKYGIQFIGLKGKKYAAHRVAWLYMTGNWPRYQIDHINGNPSDNRWINLRDVEQYINQQNRRKPQKNNQWGFLGVKKWVRSKIAKPYYSGLRVNGKNVHLGYFATPEEAHEAYIHAKRELHEGCTI